MTTNPIPASTATELAQRLHVIAERSANFWGTKEQAAAIRAVADDLAGLAARDAVPADPELTSREVNDACWAWVNAMQGKATYSGEVWNNLKPAVHAAICRFLYELRDPAYPPS